MIVTAWNNGSHQASGAGYGLKLDENDRDKFFKRNWQTVVLELEGYGDPVEVNISKSSFWNSTCRELISKNIGLWLRAEGLAPCKPGNPPKFEMKHVSENRFLVSRKTITILP